MNKLLIISDHIIYKDGAKYYTSASILYPNNFKISLFGRLTMINNSSQIVGLNLIDNEVNIVGYELRRKGALGYILSFIDVCINLNKNIRQNDLIILKMPYFSSLIAYFISIILKKQKLLYFIGFGGKNLAAKGRILLGQILDFIVSKMANYNKYNIYVSAELCKYYSNENGENLILPELQVQKYKAILFDDKLFVSPNLLEVGYVGRFSEEKGVDKLPEILSNIENIKFNLIGDGSLRDKLIEDLNSKNINYRYHGWLKNGDDLFNVLKTLDILLVPSRSEGFGLVVIESNLCGVPVIASNVGGLRSVIKNGKNGYLVDTDEEFRKKIISLSMSKDDLLFLKKSSRNFAYSFVEQNNYQEILKRYIGENFDFK
ncbi:hypothetical protein AFK20_00770 [Enhydrobacter aerosaccus]|uniref:Glycosyl transferase family 1 domain-containing protein n=1 Tax=Enhydrobacter aerosaccus TaxID=225324 RepID=A0ABR5INR5_9HYPH|nr:glycosyltransferase [Enhydrobacter aerosaccus]KND22684.1 hypothetical protein AFK20_00770 [Enhydrobacter aerosaccus]